MDDKSKLDALIMLVVSISVVLVAHMIIVEWWGGWIEADLEEERIKAESCYTEYSYNEINDVFYTRVSYCGEGQVIREAERSIGPVAER